MLNGERGSTPTTPVAASSGFVSMPLVRDVMSTDLRTVRRSDQVTAVDDLMRVGGIRHVLVLDDDGELTGVVSRRDLFLCALVKALGYGATDRDEVLAALSVRDVMASEVKTTSPDTPLSTAARVMVTHGIGCLPVVGDEGLVGILTEGDFVRLVAE